MPRICYVFMIATMIAACERNTGVDAPLTAFTLDGNPLLSVTYGSATCKNVPESACLANWTAARREFDSCMTECDLRRPCDEDDIGCRSCYMQCPPNPGPMACPTVSIDAQCTNCSENLYDSVKTCTIPNIVSSFPDKTIDILVPCDQDWSDVGECSACRAQSMTLGPFIGQSHCTCPVEGGTSWTNICRVPYEVPRHSLR